MGMGRASPGTVAEAELLACCRGGDEVAWTELVERYSRYVYAILGRGFGLSGSDAEDVFQDVFTRALEHLGELKDDQALRPWIGQLTRNLAIDRLRRSRREIPSEGEALESALDPAEDGDLFAKLDAAMDVREALSTLPEGCEEILDRFFARDQSYRTISEALDIPQGTIASRISRCLVKLRVELEGRTDPPDASI